MNDVCVGCVTKNGRVPTALDHLFDGVPESTTSILPNGRTQEVTYKIENGVYGLKPVPIS
jgi:hypothetical protein